MATRGIWQLKELTIRYCQHSGSSRYIRDFLNNKKFIDFVKENPQVAFRTELKPGRHPVLIGDYVTNEQKVCDVKNKEEKWIMLQLQRLRDSSGRKMTRMKRPIISKRPSIQGIWQQDMRFPEFTLQRS
uniref:Large ribosomal subunit protein mL43 n=1 Tax=Albugo laibachii Nc14 TaxID=890382 RepID=F0WUQ8_9STRA|nr:conserved hypothetical protein [Albugo laibachii Nc14]|eukprot:CCA25140.1 conserved hypothetical protein [Albugo laibachii Nc14]